ncbi:MAG: hypothetical protein M3342_23825, partial [Bacteroidota bacterium]|nr:hypothetical protein [Bacteroidota bacterium]
MLLGLSTYSFPWAIGVQDYKPTKTVAANDLLELAAAHSISYIQYGDNLPLHTLSKQEINNLKEKALQLNIQVEVGTRRLSAINIRTYLSIAQELQSPFLRVVIDDSDFHPGEEEVIEEI